MGKTWNANAGIKNNNRLKGWPEQCQEFLAWIYNF